MPIPRTESATRARPEGLRPAAPESGGPSAVMVVQQKQSAWQKQWQDLQSKVYHHAVIIVPCEILFAIITLVLCGCYYMLAPAAVAAAAAPAAVAESVFNLAKADCF